MRVNRGTSRNLFFSWPVIHLPFGLKFLYGALYKNNIFIRRPGAQVDLLYIATKYINYDFVVQRANSAQLSANFLKIII